jgi:RNA polymerase sigma factor (sigma-70 family)
MYPAAGGTRRGGGGGSMIDVTRTTTALLAGLGDAANDGAWAEFDARYRPILTGFARRLGLDDAGAADAAQETLLQFLREYRAGRYDRSRGRLRNWLIALARTRIAAVRRAASRDRVVRGDSAIVDMHDGSALTQAWEMERRQVILHLALDELRRTSRAHDRTLRAFELLVARAMPAAEVARSLEMSVQDVYVAKNRLAVRLREIIARIEDAYTEGDEELTRS